MKKVLVTALLALPLASQSPMFRGDAAHSGVYPASAKPLAGKVAWAFRVVDREHARDLEGLGAALRHTTTPAVVDGRIYVCAGPIFCALDDQGNALFRVKLDGCTLGSPAVAGGTAYIAADDGLLYALDIRDGRRLWTCPLGQRCLLKQLDNWDVFHSSPVVVDGTVFVGSTDGRLYAVSTEGKTRWSHPTGHVVRSSPAVADGKVFFGSFDGKVYALDAATGREVWTLDTRVPKVPWHYGIQGSCAVSEGVVYVGSRSAFFHGIDAATGKLLWKRDHQGSWVTGSPAVRDGLAYVGQSDGNKIVAVDSRGREVWCVPSQNATFGSPALSGDVLYVTTNDNYDLNAKGSLSALDSRTGKGLWSVELPSSAWASPVPDRNTVYVGCADGMLYAIR